MDYSPFYRKNFYKERRKTAAEARFAIEGKNSVPVSSDNDNLQKPLPTIKRYAGPRKKRNAFFIAALIVLCFAIVIVSADLFSGGTVLDELKETFGSDYLDKHYLLVEGTYTVKDKAEAEALAVRENGAAGYVYNTNKGYYVVLSSYADKKSAEAVKKKNSTLEIIEITMTAPSKNGLNDKQKKVCDRTLKLVLDNIDSLYGNVEALAKGTKTQDEVFIELTDMRNALLRQKEELIDSGINEDIRNAYLNILEPMFGGLDAIVYKEPDAYFLAAIRYVLIGSIISFTS